MKCAPFACVVLGALLLMGCGSGSPSPTPPGTGAREKTKEFFDALVARAWPAAYAALDAESRKKSTQAELAKYGTRYLGKLGFVPAKVYVRFCDEQNAAATAHVLLTTVSDSRKDSYRESVLLKREADGWRVVLPRSMLR